MIIFDDFNAWINMLVIIPIIFAAITVILHSIIIEENNLFFKILILVFIINLMFGGLLSTAGLMWL